MLTGYLLHSSDLHIHYPEERFLFLQENLKDQLRSLKVYACDELFKAPCEKGIYEVAYKHYNIYTSLFNDLSASAELLQNKGEQHLTLLSYLKSFLKVTIEWFDRRYPSIRFSNSQVTVTHLHKAQQQAHDAINVLKDMTASQPGLKPLTVIIEAELKLYHVPSATIRLTYRNLKYLCKLINSIINMDELYITGNTFNKVEAQLIYYNFNSRKFIIYLIDKVQQSIDTLANTSDKLISVNRFYKSLRQLCSRQDEAYNNHLQSISSILKRWLKQERRHLRLTTNSHLPTSKLIRESSTSKLKISCNLSIDQLALILRAADEVKVVLAKSLRDVFNAIAPHLSTPRKEDISPDSMRSKSYSAEVKDKKITIAILEEMILKIREY